MDQRTETFEILRVVSRSQSITCHLSFFFFRKKVTISNTTLRQTSGNKKCALNYDGYKDLVLLFSTLRFYTFIVNMFRVTVLWFGGGGWNGK
jgi:hypothetical protein